MVVDNKPPRWGDDLLTEYFDSARANQFATFHNHPMASRVIRVDQLMFTFLSGNTNPRPQVPMLFMLRAHSAYRTAAAAAMAGQVYEVNGLARTALELVSYGAYIGDDDARLRTWSSRGDSEEARKAVRDTFKHGIIRDHLRAMSRPLADDYEKLYERSIDMGAHPNEAGFFTSLNMVEGDGQKELQQVYLHGDGIPLETGLSTVYKTGMWMLHMAQLRWPAKAELKGIKAALGALRANPPQSPKR